MAGRGRDYIENTIHVVGWVDDDGNPVEEVPDRFKARYLFVDEETGEQFISSQTVGDHGISGTSLRDIVTFGFSTAEYKEMLAYEEKYFVPIRSEEELDALFPYDREREAPSLG